MIIFGGHRIHENCAALSTWWLWRAKLFYFICHFQAMTRVRVYTLELILHKEENFISISFQIGVSKLFLFSISS